MMTIFDYKKNKKSIVFGTMRMNEHSHSDSYWVELFYKMHKKGIKMHHVSLEYDSYDRYCSILKIFNSKYPQLKVHHIVKLAEPNFGKAYF